MEIVLDGGGAADDPLDPSVLMREACEEAGLEDFGEPSFVEPLAHWLESLATEANLSDMGVEAMQLTVRRFLVNRLRMQADLMAHPDILDDPVSDPIVIVGLPRTGTTKLQRMMSNDPEVQKLALWRILSPAPLPESSGPDDPRIAEAAIYIELISALHPDVLAAHPMGANEADEEAFLLEMTFDAMTNRERVRVPSFKAWNEQRPRRPSYEYLRLLLQYLQWQDGGSRDRPWILKSPAHLGSLETLLEVFPDVTIVQCHRDPVVAMASTLRLFEVQRRVTNDAIDLHQLGQEVLAVFASEMERNLKQRTRAGTHLLDVRYESICDDSLAVIRGIHERRGVSLTSAREAEILAWQEENPQYHHGRHRYALKDYGLTPHDVESAFAGYLELLNGLPR
jgi:hypothetical protein